MGAFGRWITQDQQEGVFEFVFALVVNVLFLVLAALLLWPLGQLALAASFARGYGVLWIAVILTALLVNRTQALFRVNMYDHGDAYIISNVAASCILQAGWSAFAALALGQALGGAPVWVIVIVYLIAILSCAVAFFVVSTCYQGSIYRVISFPFALVCFVVFSVWPASGRALYGWFFQLF